MFPVGTFDRQARLTADPVQVNAFLTSFNALRIRSALDLFLRVSMNLTFCYRLKRVVEVKIQQSRLNLSREAVGNDMPPPQSHVSKWLTIPFVLFSCGLVVYTHKCTTASRSACSAYPECVSHAHRITSTDRCPCLALFDIDKAPKTYEEWINPPDATQKVKSLASSGDLRVLQIINRKLMTLPGELSRCTNLKHIHIAGTPNATNLVSLPQDLFSGMHQLTSIHFGLHPSLETLSSFQGLSNLKSLTLAGLSNMTKLPELAPLVSLERLELLMLSKVQQIPSFAALKKLLYIAITGLNACCNGVLGACDLTGCSGALQFKHWCAFP
ncbi:hypothetical protein Gpo141_00007347 [Globisporangium polare]